MRIWWNHVSDIIDLYDGKQPLSQFLKQYFKGFKKLGSNDRRNISELVFIFYRSSKWFQDDIELEQKIRQGIFLFASEKAGVAKLSHLPIITEASIAERCEILNDNHFKTKMPTFKAHVLTFTADISAEQFQYNLLSFPKVFIRDPKIGGTTLKQLLLANSIEFEEPEDNIFSVKNGTKLEKILPAESYIVQDLASQKLSRAVLKNESETWWDCCAGGGGKALFVSGHYPQAKITCSDKRKQILNNLKDRFKLYNYPLPEVLPLNLSNKHELVKTFKERTFSNIICDAPCSGSGTWGRTPEQAYFFDAKQLKTYSDLQSKIACNAIQFLEKGGYFYYATCSVFKEENESVVDKIISETGLVLEKCEWFIEWDRNGDALFLARFRKP